MKYITLLCLFLISGNAYSQHKKAASAGGAVYPTQGAISNGDSFFFWDASSNATTNLFFSNLKATLWDSPAFTGSLQIPNGAAPVVDAFAEIAGDNNLWGASRGAMLFYDGTSPVAAVATLVSDTPTNGQVPKWNTGGTITWEDDNGGAGGSVATDTIWDAPGDLVFGTGANLGARLAIGSANQILQVNTAELAPEWTSDPEVTTLTATTANVTTLSFEGATEDAFETTLGVVDPTADNSILLPNTSGTVALASTAAGTHSAPNTGAGTPTWTGTTHTVWQGDAATINLPAAAGYANRGIIIYSTASSILTVEPNGSEVIVRDGSAQTGGVNFTLSAAAGNYVALISDGTRWITLGYKGTLTVGS